MDHIKLHKDCDDKKLINYGFRKRRYRGETIYGLSVPLYTYKGRTVIEVQFAVFQADKYMGYDIVVSNSNTLYSAFYDREYSNPDKNIVLKHVRKNLNTKLQSMKKSKIILNYKEV